MRATMMPATPGRQIRRHITPDADAGEIDDEPETVDTLGPGDAAEVDDEPETGPLRRCIVTRERGERQAMLRFVVGPEQRIVPDLAGKLPGRGMWLSASRDVLETARSRNAFARAARAPVALPPDLTALVEAGLTRRVTELLGLARRAGQANFGFERAREWLAGNRAGMVIQAKDGSPDERARFMSGRRDVAVGTPLSGAALGAVFGRDHVVHVVVARGRLADALKIETNRLAGIAGERGKVEQAE